ncbi:MAG TPA: ATP-binding cassette domain-containing protein [Candidatus Eisenbacteria bacterium]|nr:ATP-binding cassette domain-containing protein [Candidatus Eisenbacteria bacterium]
MPLIRLDKVSLAYGYLPLLTHVDLQIEAGERVCLVGRNGAGKTTLLRVMSGAAAPDSGEVWHRETLRIAHLEQEVPPDSERSVFDVVAEGLGALGELLAEYHRAAYRASEHDRDSLRALAELQSRIEALGGWNINQKVETILSRLNLPAERCFADCSGGTRRQVMLARALVSEPDLLLLDEPTNHLDINAICWLEEYLLDFRGALIFITHDRTFVRRLATRIIELDRGKLASFPGDFDAYRLKKEELIEIEQRANANFDKKLAGEEAWIRQGIKARRTRNEGRVRALQALRQEKAGRLALPGKARFAIDAGALSGRLVIDMRKVSFRYGDTVVVRDLSTRILRGERVGILGPNGSGKSTILKLILGELTPTGGEVVLGTRLQIAYFDQHRRHLDPEKTVRENMSDSDYVTARGRLRHVIGYLKDFLFPPERIDSPVKALSGGERNRLLLAKIFTQPANLMVLDEPTNDLDVETLELLEERLAEYDGTLLLVSHDRTFLDNVVTSTLVYEGEGRFGEYAGGYEDWARYQRPIPSATEPPQKSPGSARPAVTEKSSLGDRPRRLTYKEKRELESLPQRIESLEAELAELHRRMAEGEFYRRPGDEIAAAVERLRTIERDLENSYRRWQELESLGSGE